MSRIAYVLTQDRGGPVDVTVQLAAKLRETGSHDVMVFGPTPARNAGLLAGHHTPISVDRKGNLVEARRMCAALYSWRPDLIHAQDRRSGLIVSGMQQRSQAPRAVVQTYHGVPDDVGAQWFHGQRSAEAPSMRTRAVLAADAVVARRLTRTVVPSVAMIEFLKNRLRIPARRMAHIDNGVLLPACCPPAGPVRRLLFVGLLIPRKGLIDLLMALSVPGVMPAGATLTVAGDGPARQQAEKFARLPALSGKVDFLGFRQDVPELLARHDALVLPSRMEQQPLVIAEAMGAGKPVLATDVGGVSEMVSVPGAPSYVSPPGDVDALAGTLRALFADPRPAELGSALARRAQRCYSVDSSASRHLSLYESLLT